MSRVKEGDRFRSVHAAPEGGVYRFKGCDRDHGPGETSDQTLTEGEAFPACPCGESEDRDPCGGIATWEFTGMIRRPEDVDTRRAKWPPPPPVGM